MPQLNYKLKLTTILLALFSIALSACKDSAKQIDSKSNPLKSEIRIKVIPDIKPEEEHMSESDRMTKRFNETKTGHFKTKELLEEMNDPANWKEVTKEDVEAMNNSINKTKKSAEVIILKQIVEDSYQNAKNKK